MLVKHVVWMQFKPEVAAEQIDAHKRAVIGLKSQIPCVLNAEFGADYMGRADGLTHCIIITLESREAVQTYLNHPLHTPVAQALKADLSRLMAMDVEFFEP